MSNVYSPTENMINERNYLKPRFVPHQIISVLIFFTLVVAVYSAFISHQLPDFSAYTTVILFFISLLLNVLVTPKNFTVGFLTSLLPFLIGWRIGAMTGVVPIMVISPIAFIFILAQFFDCMINDHKHYRKDGRLGNLQWQMTFIRIYYGFNEVGHCTEKLFAGNASFHHLQDVFANYGLHSNTTFMVILAGLIELAVAIGLGMGFLTRLAGAGGVIYILTANSYGGHFFNGYTWNSKPNGGWEYILLIIVFFGSCAIGGAGKFSIDGWLISKGLMPKWLLPLCLAKNGRDELLQKH